MDENRFTILLDELETGDAQRQQNARVMLLAVGHDAVPALIEAFPNANERRGVIILDVLAEIGGEKAIAIMQQVVNLTKVSAWRRWAAYGLARMNQPSIAPMMIDWLQKGDLDERKTAALSLGYVGSDEVEDMLVNAMLDDLDVAPQVIRALERRGAVDGLAEGYRIEDIHIWEMTSDALLNLGDKGILPLVEILQNEILEYYDQVVISLQNLDRPEANEVLEAGDYNADGTLKGF